MIKHCDGNGRSELWGVWGVRRTEEWRREQRVSGRAGHLSAGQRAGEGHGAVKYGCQVEGKNNTDTVLPALPQECLGPRRATRRGQAAGSHTQNHIHVR